MEDKEIPQLDGATLHWLAFSPGVLVVPPQILKSLERQIEAYKRRKGSKSNG